MIRLVALAVALALMPPRSPSLLERRSSKSCIFAFITTLKYADNQVVSRRLEASASNLGLSLVMIDPRIPGSLVLRCSDAAKPRLMAVLDRLDREWKHAPLADQRIDSILRSNSPQPVVK